MHVNARSSNHDPNHVLDRDPKRLSERDSSPCEHMTFGNIIQLRKAKLKFMLTLVAMYS